MSQIEKLKESREFIRQQISQFPEIMEGEPNTWWRSTAKMLLNFRHELHSYNDPDLIAYFDSQISSILEQLRSASALTPLGQDDFASLADHLIMNFSMEIAAKFELKEFPVKHRFLPLSEMVKNQPERLKTENQILNGENCIVLHVKHPTDEFWQSIPLPINRKVWHKGGPARVVMDIVAHAPCQCKKASSLGMTSMPWSATNAVIKKRL